MTFTEVSARWLFAYDTVRRRLVYDVFITTWAYKHASFTASKTEVRGKEREEGIKHCDFYVLTSCFIDYTAWFGYTDRDYLSNRA